MTHTIYRGRQRLVPDPALSVLMQDRGERNNGLKILHQHFREVKNQDSSLKISKTREQDIPADFGEILDDQKKRLDRGLPKNSPDKRNKPEADILPHPIPSPITIPIGLTVRMPAFGQKNTILSEEWSVADYIFETKPISRVCPTQEVKK